MADVNANRDGHGDRGQLILVTGLLVAVAIVALVLLLNTAIYTENLASRGADQSGREAMEYRATVVDSVGALIVAENAQGYDDHHAVSSSVRDGIVLMDNFTARRYAIGGSVTRIDRSSITIHNGTLMSQTDENRDLVSSGNDATWSLITDVNDTQTLTMTVDPEVSTNESRVVGDGAFNVTLDDGSTRWQLFVYENVTSGDDVAIAVRSNGGSATEVWSDSSNQEVTIDLIEHTANGDSVPQLDWSDDLDYAHEISYSNGNEATGTYNITVNSSSVAGSNFNVDGTSPYYNATVYSATFDLSYETPTLTYRSEVRVAPGDLE